MLTAGDELGRTQQGNNNAFCQDNELSWIDWNNADEELQNFCSRLIHFRKQHPVFSRHSWFFEKESDNHSSNVKWFLPDGKEIHEDKSGSNASKCIAVFLKADAGEDSDDNEKFNDNDFLVVFNPTHHNESFKLTRSLCKERWMEILNTCNENFSDGKIYTGNEIINSPLLSLQVLKRL